jgi:hypothetical protein
LSGSRAARPAEQSARQHRGCYVSFVHLEHVYSPDQKWITTVQSSSVKVLGYLRRLSHSPRGLIS